MNHKPDLSEILLRVEQGEIRPEEGLALVLHAMAKENQPRQAVHDESLVALAENLLKEALSAETKTPVEEIQSEASFESYGIDSMMTVGLNLRLEQVFGDLSKTLFFEYKNIAELSAYLAAHHADALLKLSGATHVVTAEPAPATDSPVIAPPVEVIEPVDPEAIAVIGLSGRYPMAHNLTAFWENLKQGKDCITEIPAERWDHAQYFDADATRKDKVYSKWGGFLEDVDKFDPLFFQITPREAEVIDPQERLFLQTAWHTFEDAGYTRERISQSRVGVFVGVMYGQYQIYGTEIEGPTLAPTSSYASVANRVSYYFDLQGPSIAMDSMCSSSLSAVHMACESLRRGECTMALAGGVNLTLHPLKYVILSQQKFASTDGRCRAFGEGGDGYVPGEGVGAVLLKPLKDALADGDQVYGVIKASAINHGGRTQGYSVPNPNAQARLIAEALRKSGIHPRTLGYVEAHGTGTSLGDPIEISGLTKAFEEQTAEKQFCAIGSVKSNIGHLESAAGIAGLTKVLLQLRHGYLVPSLHADPVNPNIRFHDSPFYVQRSLTTWERPVVGENGGERVYPRRAGLSAFGAGGTNLHMLLEEFISSPAEPVETNGPCIVVLSTANQERLLEAVTNLRDHLERDGGRTRLCDISYTLQVGREALQERLALVVNTVEELQDKLAQVAAGQREIPGVYFGTVAPRHKPVKAEPAEDLPENVTAEEIAHLWVNGRVIGWQGLYKGARPARISLPGYPFAKERYWVRTKAVKAQSAPATGAVQALHPLLERNESTWENIRFSTTLRKEMYVIRDHVVSGQHLLPGVAFLEIARAAGELAGSGPVRRIQDLLWERPVVVTDSDLVVQVGLRREQGAVRFEVFSDRHGQKVVYATGTYAEGQSPQPASPQNLAAIRAACPLVRQRDEVYRQLTKMGFQYGPAFQVIEELRCGEWEALAKVVLPEGMADDLQAYGLHPSLMDGALRAALGIGTMLFVESPVLRVPFALGEIEVCGPLTEICYAHAVIPPDNRAGHGDLLRCNITILSEDGEELVRIKGFAARELKAPEPLPELKPRGELCYLAPAWKQQEPGLPEEAPRPLALLVFDDRRSVVAELREMAGAGLCVQVKPGIRFEQHGPDAFTINPERPEDYRSLLQALLREGLNAFEIIHQWNMCEGAGSAAVVGGQMELNLDHGLWSILYLFQAVTELGLTRKSRCLFVFPGGPGTTPAIHGALSGFAHSLVTVNHLFELITVEVEGEQPLAQMLQVEMRAAGSLHGQSVRYANGHRYVSQMAPIDAATTPTGELLFKKRGVYLITGGTGGLGMAVARHLASQYQASLIISGRSPLDSTTEGKLSELKELGAEAIYLSADVADLRAVESLIRSAKQRYGRINGIIHAAGIARPAPVTQVSPALFWEVLAPKVQGTLNLDLATRDEPLDLFVLFSSISALLGDFGSASYATANAFLDRYAAERDRLCRAGQRQGRTLSIDWPWWQEGGLGLPPGEGEVYSSHTGMQPLSTELGLMALEVALRAGSPQVVVALGDAARIFKALKVTGYSPAATVSSEPALSPQEHAGARPAHFGQGLAQQTERYLKNIVSEATRLPLGRIDPQLDLEQYGLDSVMIMEITRRLEQDLGSLPRTLFFEYKNLRAMTGYLLEGFGEKLRDMFRQDEHEVTAAPAEPPRSLVVTVEKSPARPAAVAENRAMEIAIVGMSGKYPMASDLATFWENLKNGKDCITEIPPSRWDFTKYFDSQKGKKGKIYSKWGGFIDDADRFDPLFFHISPREAALLDPQERLFLEIVWQAVEDAGYSKTALKSARVGVFVGAMYGHYQLYGMEECLAGQGFATSSFFASIANRVSYFMDFKGPSLALDTACSSSLEAVRLACEQIHSGNCDMAVAGGVNLSLHPSKYIFLCQSSFLAADGRCRSFGDGGEGYVPGEGVGAVLLKPLAKAVEDGDHIYAVIKGVAVNHGGRTNGYSVPNPAAQAQLISDALRHSGINPRSMSYIEAHGTGTALGDPIEVAGLTRAVREYTADKQFCSLGSVKSNIGHLEAAAGVAGLTKAVLQMVHQQLVPSLHAQTLNPNIQFEETPFFIQRELAAWNRPTLTVDGVERVYPRRAGVSAFGAGGTNVHLILEEYDDSASAAPVEAPSPQVILLSAQTENRLRARAEQLRNYVLQLDTKRQAVSLADVAYTLQVGREPLEQRLALVARSFDDLIQKLKQFLQGEGEKSAWWRGDRLNSLFEENGTEEQAYIQAILQGGNLEKLALLWVNGTTVDWSLLHRGARRRRIPLPVYPFAGERYWVATNAQGANTTAGAAALHPLLDANESTLQEQTFKKRLSQADFVIADHVVAGSPVLPGAAYLEMARAAGVLAGMNGVRQMKDLVWAVPVIVERDDVAVYVGLHPDQNGVAFQVYSRTEQGRTVHAHGRMLEAAWAEDGAPNILQPQEVLRRCPVRVGREELYESLRRVGFQYGPAFQVIEELFVGDGEALASIALPAMLAPLEPAWGMHPSLLDGVLHSVAGVVSRRHAMSDRTFVPFSLGRMEIYQPIPERSLAHVVLHPASSEEVLRFDLTVTDELGAAVLRLSDFCLRAFRPSGSSETLPVDAQGPWYYRTSWEPAPLGSASLVPTGPVLLFADDPALHRRLEEVWPRVPVVLVTPGSEYRKLGPRHYAVDPTNAAHYTALMANLEESGARPGYILHLWNLQKGAPAHDAVAGLERGVYSAQFLIQAVAANRWEHRIRSLFAGVGAGQLAIPWHGTLPGFAASLTTVNHRFELVTLELAPDQSADERMLGILAAELLAPENSNGTCIRYAAGTRTVRRILPLDAALPVANAGALFRTGGVYLISGGAGGLGMVLARYLARQYQARLALLGRSELSGPRQQLMRAVADLGGEALYIQADVTRMDQVEAAVRKARASFGTIDGVIHCAGVLGETPVTQATRHDFDKLLSPKVQGVLNLDRATRGEPLQCFVMFSSVAALIGDFGACAYAAGNSFLDQYAGYREQLRRMGERSGRTLSINWALWAEGGMQLREQESGLYFGYSGMRALPESAGLAALEAAWETGLDQVVIVAGDREKIDRTLKVGAGGPALPAVQAAQTQAPISVSAPEPAPASPSSSHATALQQAEQYLKEVLAATLNLPLDRIHPKAELVTYGLDSVTIMEISSRLSQDFGHVPKTLMFEFNTVAKLAGYLAAHYPDQLLARAGQPAVRAAELAPPPEPERAAPAARLQAPAEALAAASPPPEHVVAAESPSAGDPDHGASGAADEEIAVVGLWLRLPMAENPDQYWENLKHGINCISEVPSDRWDHSHYYDPERDRKGKSYSKWGGFVSDVDKFDSLVFNISPLEAEAMDPQERLFLEVAWAAFEDGGITRKEIQAAGNKVGVFVGAMNSNYEWLGAAAAVNGVDTNAHSAFWAIANRISFLLDFRGPSMAVDSACSSSLTALHLACESIRRDECHMALVGGVNLILHPAHYVRYSMANMITGNHQTRTFGRNADGYVPGEGVAAVVLKPLKRAIQDGNQIYGVIRSTAVNAGGKTNGFTVPNPNAQAAVISHALQKAGIDPRTISYVEAHGTATALGDPIEILGLTKAYRQYTQERQYCPIGSAKSNLGHLESAAGMAGLVKVLLQLKHKQLAPSLGNDELNPHIEFLESPFYVQNQLTDWEPPVLIEGGQQKRYPRRAGISSFGAGGANAHVIVEEYVAPARPTRTAGMGAQTPYTFVLSARTEERLKVYAARLAVFLREKAGEPQTDATADRALLNRLTADLVALSAEIIGADPKELDPFSRLDEYGFDQLGLASLADRLNLRFGLELAPHDLFGFTSLQAIAEHLHETYRSMLTSQGSAEALAPAAQSPLSPRNVAYTLHVGRQPMRHRLAIVAASLPELAEKLHQYSEGQVGIPSVYTGLVTEPEKADDEAVTSAIRNRDQAQIAHLWVSGINIDDDLLYEGSKPVRVSLPTYPFERQRHWIAGTGDLLAVWGPGGARSSGTLHPLLDRNTSTFKAHRFTKRLTGNEFYLLQNQSAGQQMLPGLVLLELARVAGAVAADRSVTSLQNVVWADPLLRAALSLELQVSLYPEDDAVAWFEVSDRATESIYAQGQVCTVEHPTAPSAGLFDLAAVRRRCAQQGIGSAVKTVLQRGKWGNSWSTQAVREVHASTTECLAKLELPVGLEADQDKYLLHPAALMLTWKVAEAWLYATETGVADLVSPASLAHVQSFSPLPAQCFIYLTRSGEGVGLMVHLVDEAGAILASLTDLDVYTLAADMEAPTTTLE